MFEAPKLESHDTSLMLPISGMSCAGCASRLERGLRETPGVVEASVNLALERADIQIDAERLSSSDLLDRIEAIGFKVPARERTIPITGMSCASCAGRVETALSALPDVLDVSVNLAADNARLRLHGAGPNDIAIAEALENAGYGLGDSLGALGTKERQETHIGPDKETLWLIGSALLTLPFIADMAAMAAGISIGLTPWIQLALAAPVQFLFGARFYAGAWRALKAGSGNMDLLVAIGTSAAFGYSLAVLLTLGAEGAMGRLYFEGAAVIITLVRFGKWLEWRAKRSAAGAIRELMELRPAVARVLRNGRAQEVPVEEVAIGDSLLVKPGERIPVDGRIREGRSELDESLVTGESLPIVKEAGDSVVAASINGTGSLTIEATAVGEDTTLSKIIRLVENAQAGKAPVQKLVDRVAAVFVPAVVAVALITFAAWILTGGGLESALIAAVSVLVIACPCALGLATPAALIAGTGVAARHGILIKDIEALERAHRIDRVVFDKTGTLTKGALKLAGLRPLGGWKGDAALRLIAAAQQRSEHPLARALLQAASDRGMDLPESRGFSALPGRGISAEVDGHAILVGNAAFMREKAISGWPEEEADHMIFAAVDGSPAAALHFEDELRETARGAIADLHAAGIGTLLLSGDNRKTTHAIASELGISEARGEVLPGDKARIVQDLRSHGGTVAMVGDGINDAPSLAAADVGIAMGGGTDVAMETAGVTLMRGDPRLVAASIEIARATWRKIRQNLFWAFIYNVIGIPLAAMGFLSPAFAGAAMALSSVSVVGNAILLRRWRPASEKGGRR